MSHSIRLVLSFTFAFAPSALLVAAEFPVVTTVEGQPLVEAAQRLVEALDYVGAPLKEADAASLKECVSLEDEKALVQKIQEILDPYCLAAVHINPESRVKVAEGPAEKTLYQQGWRTFLVKVHNEAGINPVLTAGSPQALPTYMRGEGSRERPLTDDKLVSADKVRQRFLDLAMFDKQPLKPSLSGLALEYRIIQLFSRDVGQREAQLDFNVGQGTQDLGFRNAVAILFTCQPSVKLQLGVKDVDGQPTTAGFEIQDRQGRIYPNPARRLAPDFFFHDQIYRGDGETITLPAGEYEVSVTRGPEYVKQTKTVTIAENVPQRVDFQLKRWTHPASLGWYSGDHHIHAAGCAHYDSPTEGVSPADMMRHILGEDLNVGCVLTWGPCWYSQKQNFNGDVSELSEANYLMRYDVEVSGFPSSHAGHLCLLRLVEDDYPGTTVLEEWPSWTMPVLKWGKDQGAIVGYSHSGWGLALPDYAKNGSRLDGSDNNSDKQGRAADILPDYAMPPFDGIGANEFIVTVTHDVCDFISAVDTPAIWELNVWYHTLNCGMEAKISGETDFPCIYGDKVGLGRVYVKMPKGNELNYDEWVLGVRDGRSYCGDGRSHIFDFRVNDVAVGEPGSRGKISHLDVDGPTKVKIEFDVNALLAETSTEATEAIRTRRLDQKPYWDIERCRVEGTRRVPVEIIVNGEVAVRKEIEADGTINTMSIEVDIEKSSWIAVRILPSVHTNPVFVEVAGQPIRAGRRSAQWCRDAVDVCWNAKKGRIRQEELADAEAGYDHARQVYDRILTECTED